MSNIDREWAHDFLLGVLQDPEAPDEEESRNAMAFTGYMAMEISRRHLADDAVDVFGIGLDGWMEALARRALDLSRLLAAAMRDPGLAPMVERKHGVDSMYEWRVVEPFGVAWARSLNVNGEDCSELRLTMVEMVLDWLEDKERIFGWRVVANGRSTVVETGSCLAAVDMAIKELDCTGTDIYSITRVYK